jgi:hypothetical protein
MLCMCAYGEATRTQVILEPLPPVDRCPVCLFPRGGPSRRPTIPDPQGYYPPILDDRFYYPLTESQLDLLRLYHPQIHGINFVTKRVEDGYYHDHAHCTKCFIYLKCNSNGCTNESPDTFKTPMEGPCNHCVEPWERPYVRCELMDCKKCHEIYTPWEIERLRRARAREPRPIVALG